MDACFNLQVLLLMSTALNVPMAKAPPPIELEGAMTTELRSRQQRIAEITDMIHVSPPEKSHLLNNALMIPLIILSSEYK